MVKQPKSGMLFVTVLVVLIALGAVIYLQLLERVMDSDSEVLLGEISAQSKAVVTDRIERDVQHLESTAETVSRYEDIMGAEAMAFLQEEAGRHSEILRLVVADRNGVLTRSTDGLSLAGANVDIAQIIQAQGTYISDPIQSIEAEDGSVLQIAVPISKNGFIVGHLLSAYTLSAYEQLLNHSLFGGDGSVYIIKQNGEAVIVPESRREALEQAERKSFWENETFMAIDELQGMAEDVAAGGSGMIRYKVPGAGTKYLSYTPLGINDWYLLDTIPANLLAAKASAIKMLGVYSTGFIMLLAVIFLIYWRRISRLREQDLERFAFYDSLTGLMRPEKLWEVFAKQQNTVGMCCVLINLRRLKSLQSMFGYEATNQVLVKIGGCLQQSAVGGAACRMSTEQFILLLPAQDQYALERHMQQLIKQLEGIKVKENGVVYGYQCYFDCGGYILTEEDTFLQKVVSQLVISLPYDDKVKKSSYLLFDADTKQEMEMKEALAGGISEAIKARELVPYFQPRYDLRTNKIVGAELLVRWQHPQYGLLMPGQFMSVVEAKGMSMALDLYMLDEACKMIKKWTEQELMPVPLSVNISKLNLYKADLVQQVIDVVKLYEIPPILLELEMTATAMDSESTANIKDIMDQLKAVGFLLSMDDFHDGYAILEVMRKLPVDILKLERSFFEQQPVSKRERTALESLITLANQLETKVVAQRIENESEKTFLLDVGCYLGQGFLFSEPQPDQAFEDLIFGL